MKVKGTDEILEVSINHTRKMVRVNGVIIKLAVWKLLCEMNPKQALLAIKTAIKFDGDLLDGSEL